MSETVPNLSIRARPKAVRRFNRKALMGGVVILSVIMFGALAMALQTPEHEEAEELYNVTHKPIADGLELLPKSYVEMKPVLGPPLPGDLGKACLSRGGDVAVATKLATTEIKPKSIRPPRSINTVPRAVPETVQPVSIAPAQETHPSSLFFNVGRKNNNGQAAQQFASSRTNTGFGTEFGVSAPNISDYSVPPPAFNGGGRNADPNGQADKQSFLDRASDDIYNSHEMVSPRSPYQVMAGNLIPASLVTGLNSDLPGQVIGQVTENVFDTVTGNHLLIPQGARLMGRYDSVIAFGQSRALVVWTRLILPNGDSIQLDNLPGSDAQGFAGLKDRIDNHTWQFLKGAVLSSLLSVGSELASDDGNDSLTRALQNAGQDTANIAGQRIIERNLNVQPTLKVRPGWRFNVIVSRDLILKPYGDLP